MEELTISGINEGKPITIELLNADALELASEIKEAPTNASPAEKAKSTAANAKIMVRLALLSSESLVIKPTDPKYADTIELWARRIKANDLRTLTDAFLRVNADFLRRQGIAVALPTPASPEQKTPSASSTAIPSSTPGESK